jgi:hypothetical protein
MFTREPLADAQSQQSTSVTFLHTSNLSCSVPVTCFSTSKALVTILQAGTQSGSVSHSRHTAY